MTDNSKIKLVQFQKNFDEALGITLRVNDNGHCIIARIMHGGLIHRQGLLHIGDRIVEVNGMNVQGFTVEALQKMLKDAYGLVFLKIIPGFKCPQSQCEIFIRALFDYNPLDDDLIPCPQAGICFRTRDILQVISKDDHSWWQARHWHPNQEALVESNKEGNPDFEKGSYSSGGCLGNSKYTTIPTVHNKQNKAKFFINNTPNPNNNFASMTMGNSFQSNFVNEYGLESGNNNNNLIINTNRMYINNNFNSMATNFPSNIPNNNNVDCGTCVDDDDDVGSNSWNYGFISSSNNFNNNNNNNNISNNNNNNNNSKNSNNNNNSNNINNNNNNNIMISRGLERLNLNLTNNNNQYEEEEEEDEEEEEWNTNYPPRPERLPPLLPQHKTFNNPLKPKAELPSNWQPTGLIPSPDLQEWRMACSNIEKNNKINCSWFGLKKKLHRCGNKPSSASLPEELLTYEEVIRMPLYYRKSIILLGARGVGRRHIKNTLIAMFPHRFAYPVPHTTRTPRKDEEHGKTYYFVTHEQMMADIAANKYLEFGTHDDNMYGTKLETIKKIHEQGYVAILDVEPQALKTLRTAEYSPYVIFISPPSVSPTYDEENLETMLSESEQLENQYNSFFDLKVVNNDIDDTTQTIINEFQLAQTSPQWVPISWVY